VLNLFTLSVLSMTSAGYFKSCAKLSPFQQPWLAECTDLIIHYLQVRFLALKIWCSAYLSLSVH